VAGESCAVSVRFTPSAAGVRRATLRATDAAGRITDVPLEIFAWGGDTSYTAVSSLRPTEEGSVAIIPPGTYTYDAKSDFTVGGDPSELSMTIWGALSGNYWDLHFIPPAGETLKVGRYPGATYYRGPRDAAQPGFGVSAARTSQHVTGEFTVHELERVAGIVTRVKVSYELFSEGFTGSLRGTFSWHAGDTTPLAPWMVPGGAGPAPTPTPTPTPSPTATPTATPTPAASPNRSPSSDANASRSPGTGSTTPAAVPFVPDPTSAVRAALAPCLKTARALARTPARHRRTAASGYAAKIQACRAAVAKLPASHARTDALTTLRRHATAVRTLRANAPKSAAVRKARRALKTR
jgi:hypothetical protein